MNISIVIADRNIEYTERLSEALRQYPEFTIKRCTGAEKLMDAMEDKRKKGEKFDIVLFDPDISQDKLIFTNVRFPICLYNDEAENKGLYADLAKVIKYQRVSGIYKQIMQEYADQAGYSASFSRSQKSKLIAVYSPVGGSGKTTLALTLASRLADMDKTTLFISMEQLSSSFYVNPKQEEGITTMVAVARNEKINFEMKLKGTVKQGFNGMLYLEGFEKIVDYEAVTEGELEDTLDKIRSCGVCDVILVDMESNLHAVGKVILEMADHIVLVERPGELPAAKTKLFARQPVLNEYMDKMLKIHNLAESGSQYCPDIELPLIGTVHNYGNLPLKDMIKSVLSNKEIEVDRLIGGRGV